MGQKSNRRAWSVRTVRTAWSRPDLCRAQELSKRETILEKPSGYPCPSRKYATGSDCSCVHHTSRRRTICAGHGGDDSARHALGSAVTKLEARPYNCDCSTRSWHVPRDCSAPTFPGSPTVRRRPTHRGAGVVPGVQVERAIVRMRAAPTPAQPHRRLPRRGDSARRPPLRVTGLASCLRSARRSDV